MIPKSFFMNHNPNITIFGTIVAHLQSNFCYLLKQHRCKIRIIKARSGAPGNRTSQEQQNSFCYFTNKKIINCVPTVYLLCASITLSKRTTSKLKNKTNTTYRGLVSTFRSFYFEKNLRIFFICQTHSQSLFRNMSTLCEIFTCMY